MANSYDLDQEVSDPPICERNNIGPRGSYHGRHVEEATVNVPRMPERAGGNGGCRQGRRHCSSDD